MERLVNIAMRFAGLGLCIIALVENFTGRPSFETAVLGLLLLIYAEVCANA